MIDYMKLRHEIIHDIKSKMIIDHIELKIMIV